MDIEIIDEIDCVVLALGGRLDIGTAPKLEEETKGKIDPSRDLIIDCDNLEYISSAGLRCFLQFQKAMTDGTMKVINVNRDVYEIFETTGFTEILTIEKGLKKIDVKGCELIGQGLCGECYKIDDETILKLYFEEFSGEMVECEKNYAKAAFVLGVPTAISYDMVRCGRRKGLLFEMLDAKTFSSVIASDLDNLEKYAKMFAELALQVHSIKGDANVFRRYDEFYRSFIPQMQWLSDNEKAGLEKMLNELPVSDTCVHGDFHTSNVMYADGKLSFIDMGDFSIGHPMYDIAQVYSLSFKEYSNGLGEKITKLDSENRVKFMIYFLKAYFNIETEEELNEKIKEIRRFDCVRQMFYILNFEETREENLAYLREVLNENGLGDN